MSSSSTKKHRKSNASPLMEPPHNLFPSKQEFLRLLTVLAIASSVALTCNFITTYFNPAPTNPFCDTHSDSDLSYPDFCEPCPKNGECTQGKLDCAEGYRRDRNICVEDGDLNERAKKLSESVENRLCQANAQFMCYGTGKFWIQEDDIWNDLERHQLMENLQSDNASYMFTRKRAMEIIDKLLEMRNNSNGNKELKCPDLVAESYKPLSCQLYQWIFNHAFVIAPLCVLVVGSVWLLRVFQRRWYLSARCEELYHQVCEVLEENALISKQPNGESEPWVVASQLRDYLLASKERKDPVLWKRVEQLVQEDSRVDRYPKLVKGESKVVWEWQVEGSWSSARMRKKRESSKSKSREGLGAEFGKQIHALNSGALLAE
ncbi:uncharacterized protein LOC126680111 isoform X2 [Mercurialis annua]|uniref:uncharacterized protein LOC126680111 isoform X2 n=1 Tax=Mercurialis annua TaxID=3986 RepID=UPI002160AB42|nr:uncharacterized protein LOC126680111 isoform X2 [Mercurialis annua]